MQYKADYTTNAEIQRLSGITDEYIFRKMAHTIIADIPFEVLEKIFEFSKDVRAFPLFTENGDPYFPKDIVYKAVLNAPTPQQQPPIQIVQCQCNALIND